MSRIIDFENVKINIQDNVLIENIYFNLEQKEFVFLTGKIGCGKSSFLKTIYAELPLNDGIATVFDYKIKYINKRDIPLLRRKIGFIFQDFTFLTDRNIFDNFVFVLKATDWTDSQAIKDRIKEVLTEVDMYHKRKSKPYELSGGELQRISLARAMLNKPELILADEPTGNLDEESSIYVTKKLYELSKVNTSVIFITHDNSLLKILPQTKIYSIEDKKMILKN